jgi:hypothetical protein
MKPVVCPDCVQQLLLSHQKDGLMFIYRRETIDRVVGYSNLD